MSIIIPEKLPESIDTAISNLSAPVTKSAGETLNDLFYLVFGGINHLADKKRIKKRLRLEQYEKKLVDKAQAIPSECRVEPDLQIAGQALQKSIFCIEHEELQEMFANLIAASMDSRKNNSLHPSYSEIISQLSPLDARLILHIKKQKSIPIANISQQLDKGYLTYLQNVYYSNEFPDMYNQSISLTFLNSIGLIKISFLEKYVDDEAYEFYKNLSVADPYDTTKEIIAKKDYGIAMITPFGISFTDAVT
ncbi:MAG: DUF4393 domain-containing protein [Clostridiales bacterium]|nr:DUF4393 domain-containing protein [Clostridiales bacterium]